MRIIGVDAVAGAGLEAVEDGRINASFLYPTGGEQVIRTAMRIIQGEPVDKFIPLRTAPVDHQSARTLLLQADQLQKYKQRIEAQRSRIDGLSDRFYFLRNSLGVISLLMIGFIALSIYAFYINRKMKFFLQNPLQFNMLPAPDSRDVQGSAFCLSNRSANPDTDPDDPGPHRGKFFQQMLKLPEHPRQNLFRLRIYLKQDFPSAHNFPFSIRKRDPDCRKFKINSNRIRRISIYAQQLRRPSSC